MADKKISALTALAGADVTDSDTLPIVDSSAGATKKITAAELAAGLALRQQQSNIAAITTTASSGTLPTPDGSVTIADAASPTNAELLEYCAELEAKLESVLTLLVAVKLMAAP